MKREKVLSGKHVLLGVTGGIAAYKAVELVRLLRELGATVRVVMTDSAREFISPMTFQAISGEKVLTELFDPASELAIGHIELAKWADIFLIAPATANIIAKIAHGIADDYLTTIAVAARCEIIICPAMNTAMFENRVTRANLELLRSYGYSIVGPATGSLACGEEGPGRLQRLDVIVEEVIRALTPQSLKGRKVLVTAGPTWEAFDPVRFFTNPSSGKMGFAMAKVARRRGADVILVAGPTWLEDPFDVECRRVKSAEEMCDVVVSFYPDVEIVVMAAAVSDYRPKCFTHKKIKKGKEDIVLEMVKNPDILKLLGQEKENRVLVGFAAETDELIENAREKLLSKNLDMIVANDVSAPEAGFRCDTNLVKILYKTGEIEELPLMSKEELAGEIWDRIEKL